MDVAKVLLLAGAVSAFAPPQQQVIQSSEQIPQALENAWTEHLPNLKDVLDHPTESERAIWDEVSSMYPEDMAKASLLTAPKKHTRRPDHQWDHIIRGNEIQNIWIENEEGEKERELSGKLETYDLRVKKVDPSSLKVDPGVKQYSGYLDDNENDKHLFYCKSKPPPSFHLLLLCVPNS
jgi:cathepsin A (carboxypeptidase C)